MKKSILVATALVLALLAGCSDKPSLEEIGQDLSLLSDAKEYCDNLPESEHKKEYTYCLAVRQIQSSMAMMERLQGG